MFMFEMRFTNQEINEILD